MIATGPCGAAPRRTARTGIGVDALELAPEDAVEPLGDRRAWLGAAVVGRLDALDPEPAQPGRGRQEVVHEPGRKHRVVADVEEPVGVFVVIGIEIGARLGRARRGPALRDVNRSLRSSSAASASGGRH